MCKGVKQDLERRQAILNSETKINKIKSDAIVRDILNRQKLFYGSKLR